MLWSYHVSFTLGSAYFHSMAYIYIHILVVFHFRFVMLGQAFGGHQKLERKGTQQIGFSIAISFVASFLQRFGGADVVVGQTKSHNVISKMMARYKKHLDHWIILNIIFYVFLGANLRVSYLENVWTCLFMLSIIMWRTFSMYSHFMLLSFAKPVRVTLRAFSWMLFECRLFRLKKGLFLPSDMGLS